VQATVFAGLPRLYIARTGRTIKAEEDTRMANNLERFKNFYLAIDELRNGPLEAKAAPWRTG